MLLFYFNISWSVLFCITVLSPSLRQQYMYSPMRVKFLAQGNNQVFGMVQILVWQIGQTLNLILRYKEISKHKDTLV